MLVNEKMEFVRWQWLSLNCAPKWECLFFWLQVKSDRITRSSRRTSRYNRLWLRSEDEKHALLVLETRRTPNGVVIHLTEFLPRNFNKINKSFICSMGCPFFEMREWKRKNILSSSGESPAPNPELRSPHHQCRLITRSPAVYNMHASRISSRTRNKLNPNLLGDTDKQIKRLDFISIFLLPSVRPGLSA